jgi:orotate phosphoribosyltransferase
MPLTLSVMMRSTISIVSAVRESAAFSVLLEDRLRHNELDRTLTGGRTSVQSLRQQFIEFALQAGVLRFGEFKTKAGRLSPYFFNAGLFSRGELLGRLARFYAQTLLVARAEGRVQFDMLFGPAYKGITLAAATAIALAELGVDLPFSYNRKEAKDHGEGGVIVGAPLAGRVVIIDDVITAGTSVRESVELIRAAGASPAAVLIALDRMERAGADDALSSRSAVQEVEAAYGVPVLAIATLDDLMQFLATDSAPAHQLSAFRPAVERYRERYGA